MKLWVTRGESSILTVWTPGRKPRKSKNVWGRVQWRRGNDHQTHICGREFKNVFGIELDPGTIVQIDFSAEVV